MDWNADTDLNLLKRIVALLLGLAALADRAATRPFALRCRVLDILHQAELAAHAALFDLADDFGAPALPQAATVPLPLDGDTSDAARLALRLRALALVWTGLLTWLQGCRQQRDGMDTLCCALILDVEIADAIPVPAFAGRRIDTS